MPFSFDVNLKKKKNNAVWCTKRGIFAHLLRFSCAIDGWRWIVVLMCFSQKEVEVKREKSRCKER